MLRKEAFTAWSSPVSITDCLKGPSITEYSLASLLQDRASTDNTDAKAIDAFILT
jgi:hypothetical protein